MNSSFLKRLVVSELFAWIVAGGVLLFFIIPLRKHVRLGIDLVGGTYLTLSVQTDKAIEAELVDRMQDAESKLKRSSRALPVTKKIEGHSLYLTFSSFNDAEQAAALLKAEFADLEQKVENNTLVLTMSDRLVKQIKTEAVERNVEVLRTRMRSSIAETPVVAAGDNIIVELPDTANPAEAKARIGKAAQLEFRLVEKFGPSKEAIINEYDEDIPADKEILPAQDEGFYLVERYAQVTGKMLKDARPTFAGQTGYEPVVSFKLSDIGGQKFYELTSKSYGKQLAIVLDGVVISAPRVNEPIRDSGVISGRFNAQEAKDLAMLLNSGSFVAPVVFAEERQIGPTLGAESIRQGLISCLLGLLVLLAFSLFYYKTAGIFAFVALLYNLLLILVGLAWLKATLTLPGIAGMVLTVGMAIDASILIYERIKEELHKGVNFKNAVNFGFSDAMAVILDANITTFIVGVVLYQFGTGPIKGFAVTMMLGIIATLITGLFFLKSIFRYVLYNLNVQKVKI